MTATDLRPLAPSPWGELDSLRARVDAYRARMRHGHVALGREPGPGAIKLWSNDYLALGAHPAIVKAQTAALEGGESDLYMSAVFLNETSLQRAVERQMAAFVHAEAAVLCQSGWCANTGLLQALADPSTPVYIDHLATPSSWEGARASRAPVHPFRHNRPSSLGQQIARHGPGLIVVDSIYAGDGSICPLAAICELGERSDCIVMVDESHAIGVYGPHGEGLVPALGLTRRIHYRTFSLSKAFVTRAGMVVGPRRTMSYFPYEARPAIFSSAVLPHEVARLAATLKVIQEEDWRRQQLWYNARYLRRGLRRLGLAVTDGASHLISLNPGSEQQTVALRDALEAQGIFVAVLCAPAAPKNRGIVRLSVNAGLNEGDLDRVVAAWQRILDSGETDLCARKLLARSDPRVRDGMSGDLSASPSDLKAVARKMHAARDNWLARKAGGHAD